MFTVCPKCGLMLVVTAADLRAAQGHVRCGRCRSVFNALESLSETAPQEGPAADRPMAAAEPPAPEPAEAAPGALPGESAEEMEWVEPEHEPQPPLNVPPEPLPEPPALQAEALPAEMHQAAGSLSDDGTVLQAPEPPYAPLDEPLTAEHPPDAPTGEASLTEEPPQEFQLEAPERRTGAWLAGALVLLLVLAGQVVNHYRGLLATMPSVGSKLLAVYGVLGIPVMPLWNVHAYQARQLGATVGGSSPHQITVRASIANQGPWPLPLPLLRVTLQDRYGRTIAARDVPPGDYLAHGSSDPTMLAAGERIDASVAFVNPGPQAIGFEIDACLREGSHVVCAHGTR